MKKIKTAAHSIKAFVIRNNQRIGKAITVCKTVLNIITVIFCVFLLEGALYVLLVSAKLPIADANAKAIMQSVFVLWIFCYIINFFCLGFRDRIKNAFFKSFPLSFLDIVFFVCLCACIVNWYKVLYCFICLASLQLIIVGLQIINNHISKVGETLDCVTTPDDPLMLRK